MESKMFMDIKMFKASSKDHASHNGIIKVIKELDNSEVDIAEVGKMFNCRSSVGEFSAFEDELSDIPFQE